MPDKSPEKISSMFDEIAGSYDKLNHAFTLNLDKAWRKQIVSSIRKREIKKDRILDLATGTGDLALELVRSDPEILIAADFSREMLEFQRRHKANPRIQLLLADASRLPFEDNYFDIVTIGFGVRNFHDLNKCLREIARVLKPGGHMIVLEIFRGKGFFNKAFNFYFGKIMPVIGNRISGSSSAYSYLFRSVESFYSPSEFADISGEASFELVFRKNNFLGVVNTMYFARR